MTMQTSRAIIDKFLSHATTTRQVVMRSGALADVARLIGEGFPDATATIVADETTFDLAGRDILDSLRAAGQPTAEPIVFPSTPTLRPDFAHIGPLRDAFSPSTVPIAVGSGTINDLTKRAAHEARLPYIVVATAASMDGYTASGAALVADGVKQTFDCAAPRMVVADLDIIRRAPARMTASGYGDLVGKVTAGADWIVADSIGVEPILPDVWEMVQGPLRVMIGDPASVQRGDPAAIEALFLGLVTTGLAIQAAGSTRPASGSEHQFSHLWEMRGLEHNGELVSHGMKVALGSLFSTVLYERFLTLPLDQLDVDEVVSRWPTMTEIEADIRGRYSFAPLVEKALEECRAKYVDKAALRDRLVALRSGWSGLAERLGEQLLPSDELQGLLELAGCPVKPEDIGLARSQFHESYLSAGQIRRRYTIFDLATETGVLNQLAGDLFAPGGYWAV